MLNTFVKNQGISKTIIHNNGKNYINSLDWDLDYDGNIANVSIGSNYNGKHNHYDIALNNDDLERILNINSINKPIDQRLLDDFNDNKSVIDPYLIELPAVEYKPKKKLKNKGITSPLPNEEFIVPVTINKSPLTPKRRHKRHKSHSTHRAYKKHKSKSMKNKIITSLVDLF